MKIGLIDVDGHHYPNLAIRTGRKTGPRPSQGWRRLWLNNGEVSVMDDIKLAMLGSKEAAKRLADAGVLVPCAHCGGNGKVSFKDHRFVGQNFQGDKKLVYRVQVICNKCRSRGKPVFTRPLINPNPYITKWGNCYENTEVCNEETKIFSEYVKSAIHEWNTRAPILSAEELEMLEGMENG